MIVVLLKCNTKNQDFFLMNLLNPQHAPLQ